MRRSVAQAFACEGSSIMVYCEMSIYFRSVRSLHQCAPSRVLRLCGIPRVVSERHKRFARTTASSIHPQLMQRVDVYRGSDSMPKSSKVSQTRNPRQRWHTICPPSAPKTGTGNTVHARSFTSSIDAQSPRDRRSFPHALLPAPESAPRPAASSDHQHRHRRSCHDSSRCRSVRRLDLP